MQIAEKIIAILVKQLRAAQTILIGNNSNAIKGRIVFAGSKETKKPLVVGLLGWDYRIKTLLIQYARCL